ncbi:hypothetical protein [Natronorarus salvus]|uniref:hypothetical protein n=1 Tax=Natronorarus salvus TaxID=3117733 RepID=UPI002F2676B0
MYLEFRDASGVWGTVRQDRSIEYDGIADDEVYHLVATACETRVDTPYPPPEVDFERLMLDLYGLSTIVSVEKVDRGPNPLP